MKCRYPFMQYMPNKPDKFEIKEFVVLRLTVLYKNSGTNITCNNYFSSISLSENSKKINITFVGTIRKIRRELPPSIQRRNQIHSTRPRRYFNGLSSKKNKNVLLLSTMHQDVIISDTQKRKPDRILFYNANKILWALCAGKVLLVELQGGGLHILAENSKKINISFVGTIRKNRRELPTSIQRRNQIHITRVY
ncbi:hypothetical protein J437_LFUL016373 [Ladona fulva]|uniref:PiggyBac transposable element-derived protein domain-containing protein n=1 Tax=Ladona fulva TaxID=123851 RepID=A0A8K0P7S6_LADFU|nr:hypothetical protein J437_LFUL016373 [Ladona fulva]